MQRSFFISNCPHFIQIRSPVQSIDLLRLLADHRAGVHPGAGGGAIRHLAA
ncbi:MAG: hypothetical protein L6282_06455 [Candidatus Methanoperedenaceae archaeon]|nr:hypothetical protein [Candidatus Methanoperedenaceae archaeon]